MKRDKISKDRTFENFKNKDKRQWDILKSQLDKHDFIIEKQQHRREEEEECGLLQKCVS